MTNLNFKIKKETNKICLNSSDILFESFHFEQNGQYFYNISKIISTCSYIKIGITLEITKIESKEDDELVVFYFENFLQIGHGKFTIKYTGRLNDNMKGFYRAKYKHSLSKQPYTATTQFEVCVSFQKINKIEFI